MLGLTRICILLLSLPGAATAATPIAVPTDGDPFAARLSAADAKGLLTFATVGGEKTLAASGLVRWGDCAEPDRAPVFVLRDGTLLVAGLLEAGMNELALDSDAVGLVRLAPAQIAAIVMQLPAARLDRDRLFDEAVRNDQATTRIVLLNGDRMYGELLAIDAQNVSLRTSVGPVALPWDRVSTLTFPSASQAPVAASTVLGLADGSRIRVRQWATVEGSVTMETVGGAAWKAGADQLVFVQPAPPRVVYLSDLEPIGYRHVPYLDRTWEYRADRNVQGGLIRCGGRLHLRGLGMFTAARISYAPPENAAQFQASLGIDDATEGMGSVRFRVFVDAEEKYVSPTVRGLAQPVPIRVDVRGARQIDLVVDYADRADVQDQADWLDARFVLGEPVTRGTEASPERTALPQ
ncbi:MAG: NPCBM/NEW2 domain-containing protein [Thermoguttaceae bacterium]